MDSTQRRPRPAAEYTIELAEFPAAARAAEPTDPLRELTNEILMYMRLQLPASTYNVWVQHLRVTTEETDRVVLTAPDPMTQEWLSIRLRPLLERTILRLLGRRVLVEIVSA